ncbi:MAG TPA: YhjD/YihY/BrkB family envelope integrity protein [Oligoflexia bacterium]|nr:YhjD/YihY/BrkB family envelope integrity protein [Oligoflexia bacterium]HMP47956.1 YhjD/YihY/BrkB family envelope integrity protein [Oligoflexia bacterium]
MKFLTDIRNSILWLFRVVCSAASKFWWDDCFSKASSLAYSSLFALVPGVALIFGMFSGFNVDAGFVDDRFGSLLEQLLPPNEDELLSNLKVQLTSYLTELADAVRGLGILSLPVLVFTGIALVNTIESSLNVVWRVSSELTIISKIVNFWAVITLGPLLVLVSFYWYARFSAGVMYEGSSLYRSTSGWGLYSFLDVFVPVFAIFLALTLMFYKLPAARVTLRDAMLGALFSAVLFECLKRSFAYYISVSATYKTFYGVLVSLPLFLFWLYVAWMVVLYGAQVAYQAGSISVLSGLKKYASELGEVGGLLGLRILCVIGKRFQNGDLLPTESEIAVETGSDPVLVRTCLGILAEAGLITSSDPVTHSRALTVTPDKLSLSEIALAFRAKQYRISNSDNNSKASSAGSDGEMSFIEALRQTARIVDPISPVRQWTLADVLYGQKKASAVE